MVILEEKIDPPKEALGKEKNFSMVFFFEFHVSFPLYKSRFEHVPKVFFGKGRNIGCYRDVSFCMGP